MLSCHLLASPKKTFLEYHQCQTVWIQIRPKKNIKPDLDPNCLQRLSWHSDSISDFYLKKNDFDKLENFHANQTSMCLDPQL